MRAKTRQEIITRYYLNASEIQRLLGIPREKAREAFEQIDKQERQKRFRAHEGKVPLPSVLELMGINYQFLARQIESEARHESKRTTESNNRDSGTE